MRPKLCWPTRRSIGSAGALLTIVLTSGCAFASGGGGHGRTLSASYMQSGTYDKAAEGVAKDFKPKINIITYPYAALRQANTTDLISGTCHTSVMSGSYYLASLYNRFRPLDDFIHRTGYGKGIVSGLWNGSEFYQGHRIGIPYGSDAYGLVYRTDLWRSAGLSFPKDWPTFLSDLARLHARLAPNGIAAFTFAAGAPEQLPSLLFASYDGYFLDRHGKFALDPAKATAAIQYGQRLLGYAPNGVTGQSIDQANAQFLQGKAATLYGYPSFIQSEADNPTTSKVVGKWALAPTPRPGFDWLSLWQLYMPRCTTDANAAWKWMTTFSNPANDKRDFINYGVGPVYTSTFNDPRLRSKLAHYFPAEQANLQRALNPPLTGEAQDYMASTLSNVFTGQLTPRSAVSQINAKWATLPVPAALTEAARRHGLVQR